MRVGYRWCCPAVLRQAVLNQYSAQSFMKRLLTAIFICLSALGTDAAEVPIPVSMVQLIATPKQFNGKRVMVYGYLDLALRQREGRTLYLHKEDFEHGILKNAVTLDIEGADFQERDVDRRYVGVVGVFKEDDGPVSFFSGNIKVDRIRSSK